MKTKFRVLAIAMVTGLKLVGTASAYNGGGGPYHHGRMQGGPMYQQLDQATQDKIKTFWDSNQSLQKEMMMKNAERQALLNSTNADPTAVAKVAGELFDLRTTLIEKAEAAGVSQYMGRNGMGAGQMGCGYGRGGGYGRRANW